MAAAHAHLWEAAGVYGQARQAVTLAGGGRQAGGRVGTGNPACCEVICSLLLKKRNPFSFAAPLLRQTC